MSKIEKVESKCEEKEVEKFEEVGKTDTEMFNDIPKRHCECPQPLKDNYIEVRREHNIWGLYIHIWYKCLKFYNYEYKQSAVNAAEKIQQKYLPNFKILIEESFF